MGVKEVKKAFSEVTIPEVLRKLGIRISDDFGEFVKLNSPERDGRYFFGILQEMPKEEKPKGFKKPATIAQFTELDAMSGEQIGVIKLLLSADLKGKISKCRKGDTLMIWAVGEKEVNKAIPMLVYGVAKLHTDFTGLKSLGIDSDIV